MIAISTANRAHHAHARIIITLSLSCLTFVPSAYAQRFQLRHSLTPQTTSATTSRQADAPLKVSGKLESQGVGLFISGNREDVVTVVFVGDFQGNPNQLTGKGTQTVTFGDGSTLRLNLDLSSQGKRYRGKITGGEGTGRFKGAQMSGSLTGNAIDPTLSYVDMQGDIKTP